MASNQLDKIKQSLTKIAQQPNVKFALSIYSNYNARNGPLLAAGLAFFMLLACVPLLLVGIACLGYYLKAVGNTGDASQTVEGWISNHVLPGVSSGAANDLISKVNIPAKMVAITHFRSLSGIVGLFGLISASLQIFLTGSVAMNAAWGVPENRGWVKLRLLSLALLLGSGILTGLSIAATTAGTLIEKHFHSFLVAAGTEIVALIPDFAMYTLIFWVLPATKVNFRAAMFGGLTAAFFFEIAKKGLAVYLVHPNPSVYGGLADLFALLLWLYYSMMILLLGAEAAAAYEARYAAGAADTKLSRP